MKEKTGINVYRAFVAEAKANQRLVAFAERAETDGYAPIARLFRAMAAAEGVHARRHFRLLERTGDTESNLKYAFEQETAANGLHYPAMLKDALAEDEKAAAFIFSQARDVEEGHAGLYKKALNHLMEENLVDYHVCTVCGYIAEKSAPDSCPICNAPRDKFELVR